MTHDENTAMERSYHPTGAELWFLLSLLDDRPAPLFWPMGEPAENWPLVAVRLLDAGLAVRGENGLTPAAPLAPLLDTVKSADRAALVFLRTLGGAVDAVLYYNRVGGVLLRRESAARYTLQALDTAALLAALPPLNGAGEGTLYPEFIPPADLPPLDADGTPCREDAATAALVELFAPDCTRLARWQWLDTGCGCKVRRQTPDGVTTAPDGPGIRAALAAALTGEDAPC